MLEKAYLARTGAGRLIGRLACSTYIYFAIFSQKFIKICATSARVAPAVGARVLFPLPDSRPAFTAQSMAFTA